MNSRFRNNINNQEIIVVIHKMSQTSKISKETIFRHKLDNINFLNI
jgi:ABC-type phosphate transport system ATPase subunit